MVTQDKKDTMKDLFGSEPIRALSWKQPFGSLMLHGKIETRKWATKYRGLVLICCSQKEYTDEQLDSMASIKQVGKIITTLSPLDTWKTFGKAIAIGRLVDCRPMTIHDEDKAFIKFKPAWKEMRKNKDGSVRYVVKRLYCHIYADVRPIKPFDFKGAQGWRKLTKEVIEKIEILTVNKTEKV